MGLSDFQRSICQLLATRRRQHGESYLAGGATLNELLGAPRLSHDLDIFHDTDEALAASWQADRTSLIAAGYRVDLFRERSGFVEAQVILAGEGVLMQWARDSAFRFYPLVEHRDFGLTLHPFDLATSKILALVGRVEVRDFVDTLTCVHEVQALGFLAWAACGKDPGFSPAAILEEAARTSRYSDAEVRTLAFSGDAPDAAGLSRLWRTHLNDARSIVAALPPDQVGQAVLDETGRPYRGGPDDVRSSMASGRLRFHPGSIRGALPTFA